MAAELQQASRRAAAPGLDNSFEREWGLGGLAAFGLIGLFVGPVILAILHAGAIGRPTARPGRLVCRTDAHDRLKSFQTITSPLSALP